MSQKYTVYPGNEPPEKPGMILSRTFREALLKANITSDGELHALIRKFVEKQNIESTTLERTAIQNIKRGLADTAMSWSMFVKGMRIINQAFTIQLGNGSTNLGKPWSDEDIEKI